jgi:LCP family protein required for cell wall assembly
VTAAPKGVPRTTRRLPVSCPAMQTPDARDRQPSAFAAAFFSAVFPGLGQAYLGRWRRALAWAAPVILGLALLIGVIRVMGLTAFFGQFFDTAWDVAAIALVVVELIYSTLSALDAFRLAQVGEPSRRVPAVRFGSGVGLVAVLLVLTLGHAAMAYPFLTAEQSIGTVTGDNDPTDAPGATFNPSDYAAPPSEGATATEAPGATPGATAAPTDTPEPTAPPCADCKDRVNILLVGVDSGRPNERTFNTDTMIVVSVDPATHKVALISIPRDTGNIPLVPGSAAARAYGGLYPSKINTLYNAAKARPDLFTGTDKVRGYKAIMDTLGSLYGLDINYYVSVDLAGFRDAIDALGGTMIDVQMPVNDPFYPADDGRGYLKLYISPGYHYMDGSQALAYARSRHGLGNDYIRAARQERVVTSVREQFDLSTLLEPGVLGTLLKTVSSSVRTNIPSKALPGLISLAQGVDLNRRVSLVLSPPSYGSVCFPCPPSGLWMIKPNVSAMRHAVADIFKTNPQQQQQRDQLEAEGAVVDVLNGTADANTKTTQAADYLASLGINASVPPVRGGAADKPDYTDAVITAYNGADQDMATTAKVLSDAFGVPVQSATDPSRAADFVVIVGSNTPVLKPPPGGY